MKKLILLVLGVLCLSLVAGKSHAAPAAPSVTVSTQGASVTVSWTSVSGATGYTLCFAPYPWQPWMTMEDIGYADMGSAREISLYLWEGASYYIAAQAYNSQGSSNFSNIEYFIMGPPTPEWTDGDADGFIDLDGDCNDANAGIFPNAREVCGDGIDQDCDGTDKVCVSINNRQPDLAVTSVIAISSPLSVSPGGKITLPAWIVINQGNVESGNFSSGFYLSTDAVITNADIYLDGNSNGNLSAGADFVWGAPTLTIPVNTAPGNYYIGILADHNNSVREADENNNYLHQQITVVGSQAPAGLDLVISSGPPSVTPAYSPYIAPGGVITVSDVTILNNGNLAAGNFNSGIYLSTNSIISSTDTLLKELPNPFGLMAGGEYTIRDMATILPANIPFGYYYIGILIDKDNSETEFNENNNYIAQMIDISAPKPDLAITTGSLVTAPASASRGGVVGVPSLGVINNGVAPMTSGGFYVGYYLSTDSIISSEDILLKEIEYPWNLWPGSSYTGFSASLSIPASIAPGGYYLGALIDIYDRVDEHNENNNYLSQQITIVP